MMTLEASKLLKVSTTTLRTWADAGIIKADVSPVGIRRYSEEDVYRLKNQMEEAESVTDEDELIKTGVVARILNISKPTVRKYTEEGFLKAVSTTPTGLKLYIRADIEEIRNRVDGKSIAQLRQEYRNNLNNEIGTDIKQ